MGETKASTLATLKTGHTAALNKKLLTWFKSGDHSDCTIEVGTVDSKLFKCHRLTLAAASPVFERMLFGNFEESKKGIDDPIALPDVTPTTFQAAMNFVYGCDTSLLQESFELTLHVFEFASKWEISDLDKVAAEICFGLELSAEDLLILHNLFLTFSFQAEAKRIMNLICDRGSEVLKYLQIASKETVHAILCQESINIFSEKDLLDGVQTWGSAQVEASADGRKDFEEVRAVITELLELIRFKAFTIRDFGHLAMTGECPVLKNHEKLNLLALAQVQKGDTYPSISKFDVASNWRGKFKQDTRKVACLNATRVLGNTTAITVTATSDVYLLSVGLNSLKYLERYPQSVHFSIVVYHNEKVLSKVEHEIVCEHDQKDLMFSLANPLLLKSGLDHKIVVNHILNVDTYQCRYKVDNDFIVTNATAVHDGVRMRCVGLGDVCALECASP